MSDSMMKVHDSHRDEVGLVGIRTLPADVALTTVLRGPAGQVCANVANLRAEIQQWLKDNPEDYLALVLLGEIDLRLGLKRSARELLYRASLLRPPSWEHFQRTSLLLRLAEADQAKEVDRVAGVPPPAFVLAIGAAIARGVGQLLSGRAEPRLEGTP